MGANFGMDKGDKRDAGHIEYGPHPPLALPSRAGLGLANIIIVRRIRVRYEHRQAVDDFQEAAVRIS